jgi:cation diffusion facilitator CzcD-associated flavoprotein CzcO
VKVETFSAYGLAFQQSLVPNVEDTRVLKLDRVHKGYVLTLENGESFTAQKVVVGVGLNYFRNIPPELADLPGDLATHSADHHDLSRFRGRDVAVIGGGSSAIDLAVLLHEAGARPVLIARKSRIEFAPDEPLKRSLLAKLHRPMSGVGPGWKNRACTDLPWAFRYLPDEVRLKAVRSFLGPAGGWFMKSRMEPVGRLLGHDLRQAREIGGRVQLRLAPSDGSERTVTVDHAIAATGFRQDAQRLPFLSREIISDLGLLGGMPRLSANFESTVPGLYFIGPITANTFGPVMRFSIGAAFTSRRLSRHLASITASQRSFST